MLSAKLGIDAEYDWANNSQNKGRLDSALEYVACRETPF